MVWFSRSSEDPSWSCTEPRELCVSSRTPWDARLSAASAQQHQDHWLDDVIYEELRRNRFPFWVQTRKQSQTQLTLPSTHAFAILPQLVITVLDRGSRLDRPRYHVNSRWTLPLPVASAAPRRMPRRDSKDGTITVVSQYQWWAVVNYLVVNYVVKLL